MAGESEKSGGNSRPLSIGAALLALAFLTALYFVPQPPPLPEPPGDSGSVAACDLSGAGESLLEAVALGDGAPLFFYTKFNYGNIEFELPTMRPMSLESGGDADTYEALAHFEASILKNVDFASPKLMSPEAFIHTLFGREARFLERGGGDGGGDGGAADAGGGVQNVSFSVSDFDSGELLHSEKLSLKLDTKGFFWSPVEMTVFVSLDGSPSAPLATSQSGIELLDRAFEDYARKNSGKLNLKPGFYKFVFAP